MAAAAPVDPSAVLPVDGAIIAYARVSTVEQSLSMQVQAFARFAPHRIITEKVSAAAAKRPALERALSMLREGDTFIVWKLDRLARSLPDLLKRVAYIEERGAKLVSVTENIDTSTPSGRLLFHVLGALAQFERDLIRERTTSGMKAARDRGVKFGPKPRYSVKQREQMQRDRDRGLSLRRIADKFGCAMGTVQKWTAEPVRRRTR